jgi:hypothetical protein
MSNEYTAWFEASEQITEDRFRVICPHLKITDETTIREIVEWYRKTNTIGLMSIHVDQLTNKSK